MNSVNLIGNISTDIELTATPGGKFVAKFNLAVNNPFNREKTNFLPIEVWGTTAQNTGNYCKKGSKVSISGYIEVDSWEKDGQKRYKTKVVASQVGFMDSKGNTSQQENRSHTWQQNAPQTKVYDDPFAGGGQINIQDDDLPF